MSRPSTDRLELYGNIWHHLIVKTLGQFVLKVLEGVLGDRAN